MAAHSYMMLGGEYFLACREGYLTELAAIFQDDELQTDLDRPIYALGVRQMRERLDVLGFTPATARRHISLAYEKAQDHGEDDLVPIDAWLDELRRATQGNETSADEVPSWVAWSVDPRLIVRLALDVVGDDVVVGLDISDVVGRGYVKGQSDFCASAYRELHEQSAYSPIIVLTEGASDAEFLALAVKVLAPHLEGYMRFMNYEFKPEGSTSGLVRAIRAFAAAGVNNRMIGLFDNDTAAAEAIATLNMSALPSNFKICQLPDLPLARKYPTLGPNGLSIMNVNGLAASIEMYFGEDTLRLDGRNLCPIQWRGYASKVRRYQGEVLDKHDLQRAFRLKASGAISGGDVSSEDWSGMELIINQLKTAFA